MFGMPWSQVSVKCLLRRVKPPVNRFVARLLAGLPCCAAVLLPGLFVLTSCSSRQLKYQVSALFYSDSQQEKEFLRQYNQIFTNADLDWQVLMDKALYYDKIQVQFQADQLPDLFSLWNSMLHQFLRHSPKLADLRKLLPLENYNKNIFHVHSPYQPVKMLPVRYNYGNVMLVNMEILRQINRSLNVEQIVSYEDFLNLARITKEKGLDFLVLGDSAETSLADLFFSAAAGWLDRLGLVKYPNAGLDFSSERVANALYDFYSGLLALFPDPDLAQLDRTGAEKMFREGKVLMIMGSTEQLFPLMEQMVGQDSAELSWLAFPRMAHLRQGLQLSDEHSFLPWNNFNPNRVPDIDGFSLSAWFAGLFTRSNRKLEQRRIQPLADPEALNPMLTSPAMALDSQGNLVSLPGPKRGAVLGDVLGVAVSSRVWRYSPLLYNEVTSVLNYYAGLYASGQRIRNWNIPTPASRFVVADNENTVMSQTIAFLDSINYVYYRPSTYLPQMLNEYLNEETGYLLEGRKGPELFVRDLLDFIAAQQLPADDQR